MSKPSPAAIVIVILAVFIGGGLWLDHERDAQRAELTGYFEYRPTDISSRVTGRVIDVNVDEGDPAKSGTVLVKLDAGPQEQDALARQAQAQQALDQLKEAQAGPRSYDIARQQALVETEQAQVDKLVHGASINQKHEAAAQVQAAQAAYDDTVSTLKNAKADLASVEKSDSSSQPGSDQQLQIEKLLVDSGPGIVREREAQLQQARDAQQTLQSGPRAEDIDAAKSQLLAAQETLSEMKAGTRSEEQKAAYSDWMAANKSAQSSTMVASEQTVKAPFTCEIEHVLVSKGDLVPAGAPLLRVSDPSDIWLRVYVPENQLAKISVGQSAVLSVDGIDGNVDAVVKSIATTGEFTPANLQSPEERGQQVYAVRLKLAQPDNRIKAGMAATVRSIGDWSP